MCLSPLINKKKKKTKGVIKLSMVGTHMVIRQTAQSNIIVLILGTYDTRVKVITK